MARMAKIFAGGLFALFCAFCIATLNVFGVISMILGHIFLLLAFAAGAALIATVIIPGKAAKYKVGWIALFAFAMFVFDRVAVGLRQAEANIPSPSAWSVLIESLSSWFSRCADYVSDLPWRWIVPSFAIGVLVTALVAWRLIFLRHRERQARERELQTLICPEQDLHKRKADDKDRIKELVRIAGISYQPEFSKAYIDFGFSIFNMSLYDIIIDCSIKRGAIRFGEDWDKFFYEPKIESDQPIMCRSRAGNYFVIRQAVRPEEIVRFCDSDNLLISFGGLEIRFREAEPSSATGVETVLDTNHYVETKKRVWRPLGQLQFVFGYTNEQWAEIASGKDLLEKGKSAITPIIKEAHIIPSAVGADCFVRLEVRGSEPMRVMDYQMKLITKEGEYIGTRADVRGYFLLNRSGGQFDEDGDQIWKEIRKETLRNIGLNAPVSRVDPLTGWIRFCFEGLPKWEVGQEFARVGVRVDESGHDQQCAEYDPFFIETTATGLTVVVIDSDGKHSEAYSKEVSCDQSKTIKELSH